MQASLWMAAMLAFGMAQALAEDLVVERVELGDTAPGVQAYNLQEAASRRVFARSAAGFVGARIYWQERDSTGWSAERPMPFADSRWKDSDPALSPDGKRLLFVSDRGGRSLDLYESVWDDAQQNWGAPRRLDEVLQSPAIELGPESFGVDLYFASTREARRLQVLRARPGQAAQALPAPINIGQNNSDFTLSRDGRWALWWSDRSGSQGGADLYLAERVGDRIGPALRLPEPINGEGFDFTPSVSADGRWLHFASTRGGTLSHVYRVSWPAVLAQMGEQAQRFSRQELERANDQVWRAFERDSEAAQAVVERLHPRFRMLAQRLGANGLELREYGRDEALRMFSEPGSPVAECEVSRELARHDGVAVVRSVVNTRSEPGRAMPGRTGVNHLLWQLGPQGWQLLELQLAMERAEAPLLLRGDERCIGRG